MTNENDSRVDGVPAVGQGDLPRENRNEVVSAPPKHLVDFAVEVAGWSPCQSKRGVVIFRGDDILTHGHNYKPRGFDCDGSDACKATCRVEAVHAEQQALLTAPTAAAGADMLHVKAVDGHLVPSGGPSCVQCSKLALVVGIAGVWLYHDSGWHRYDMKEFHALSLHARTPPDADAAEILSVERSTSDRPRDIASSSSSSQNAAGRAALASGARTDADADDGDALHTGDDDRLDLVTSILAGAEEIEGNEELTEIAAGIIDDCHKLDVLILATIKRERLAAAPPRPPAPPTDKLRAREDQLAKAVDEYLAALHDVRDPASIDRVRGWRLSIATAACNWLDARKVAIEAACPPALPSHWQPIETAPTDGTEMLLWGPQGADVGHWLPGAPDERESGVIVEAGMEAGVYGCKCYWPSEPATHWAAPPRPPAPPRLEKGEHVMTDENTSVWYGPHECSVCGVTIVKAALEDGGAEFEPPARLMRAYRRGSEAFDVDLVYPMTWTPHVHVAVGAGLSPRGASPAAPPEVV